MPKEAYVGHPPAFAPTANTCEFIFSNPAQSTGNITQNAQTEEQKALHTPKIPLDRPIFVDPATGAKLTWKRLRDDSLRIGASLQALNLQPPSFAESQTSPTTRPVISPIILIHLPNCMQFNPILFGVWAAGLTATLASPALTAYEVGWVLQNAQPSLFITSRDASKTLQQAVEKLEDAKLKKRMQGVQMLIVDPLQDDYGLESDGNPSSPTGESDWKQLLGSRVLDAPVAFTPEQGRARSAVILWSSGTSGKPKGVVLSHAALNYGVIQSYLTHPEYVEKQTWLGMAPFYHVFGLVQVTNTAVSCGATVLIMPKFDPEKMLRYIQDWRVTSLHFAPPVAVVLAKSPLVDGYDLSSVKAALCGGAPLGVEVIKAVYDRLRLVIRLGYGSSEAQCTAGHTSVSWEDIVPGLGSCGQPVPGVEIKVVDLEDGSRTLKRHEEGEVLMRSPSNMNCYLNNPEATNETLDADGWCHNGDVGKIDDAGNLWITDRIKDMIKVKGYQVAPAELEDVLCGSNLVADAGVAPTFDKEQQTELPVAYVVPKDESLRKAVEKGQAKEADVVKFALAVKEHVEKEVIHYKRLRGGLIVVAQIPKSPSGKILRRFLKETKGFEVDLYGSKRPKAKI